MRRLFVHFGQVGDLVLFTPLLRHLARDGEVELLSRPWGAALLGGQPYLSATHTLRKPNVRSGLRLLLFGPERTRLGERLAERGFSEVVNLAPEKPVVTRWIEGWKGAAALRTCDLAAGRDASAHALRSLGFPMEGFDEVPRLHVPEAVREAGRRRLDAFGRRVVVVHPGASETGRYLRRRPNLKGLGAAQWGALVDRVLEDVDAVVITGTAPERREARAILAALPPARRPRVHDLTGALTLPELCGLLASATALLSVDTGPAHIAAAVACPLLDVFGPTDPERFRPYGSAPIEVVLGSAPCQFCLGTPLWKSCRDNVCLKSLPSAALTAGWERLRARLSIEGVRS